MKNLYLSKEEIVVFSKGSEDSGKGRRIEEESVGVWEYSCQPTGKKKKKAFKRGD